MQNAILRNMVARGADLSELDFSYADLQDADMSYAILRNCSLIGARLEGALFEEAGALLTTVFVRREDSRGERWRLAGGTENGMLVLWDSASDFPSRIHPHSAAIKALDMRQDRAHIFSVSDDGALYEADLDDPDRSRAFPLAMGGLRAMVVVNNRPTVIVGGDYRTLLVRVGDPARSLCLYLPAGRGAVVTSMVLDPHHGCLMVGDSDGDLYRFDDWSQPSLVGRFWAENLGSEVCTLIALADGCILALTVAGQAVIIDDQERVEWGALGAGQIDAVCYARNADTLFWLDGQRLMRWDRRLAVSVSPDYIGQIIRSLEVGRPILGCSPDGGLIAAGGEHLVVWRNGREGLDIVRTDAMRMDCVGLSLKDCSGLDDEVLERLVDRGARL